MDMFQYVAGLYYGTKLKYLAIEVNTTMNVYSLGYQEGMPIYMKWEELVNDLVLFDILFPQLFSTSLCISVRSMLNTLLF